MMNHERNFTSVQTFHTHTPTHTHGAGSKPCTPGEHQNSWYMNVHYMYCPVAICIYVYRIYLDILDIYIYKDI